MLGEYRERGWKFVTNDEAEAEVRRVLPTGLPEEDPKLAGLLRNVLEEEELGGFFRIFSVPGEGEPHERISMMMYGTKELPDLPEVVPDVPETPEAPALIFPPTEEKPGASADAPMPDAA
jgi:hypothetical protein